MTQSPTGRREADPRPDMTDVLVRAHRIRRNHRIATGMGVLALVLGASEVGHAHISSNVTPRVPSHWWSGSTSESYWL